MQIKNTVLNDLGFRVIQHWLSNHCQSIGGQNFALEFHSNLNLKDVTEKLDLTDELFQSMVRKQMLPDLHIPEIYNWTKPLKLADSQLTSEQFEELFTFLIISRRIKTVCKSKNFPNWKVFTESLFVWVDGELEIKRVFDKEFQVKSSASKDLSKIRKNIKSIQSEIQNKLNKIFQNAQSKNWLQDNQLVWRDERLMLPMQSIHKRKVKGIIHSYSSTGLTAFIEPLEIIEKNNELSNLNLNEQIEIRRILRELTQKFHPHAEELEFSYQVLIRFDYHVACAQFANQFDCVRPDFSENSIEIIDGRNPQLLISDKKPVPLSCRMEDDNILLISGPNAGGKTVAIKTVGVFTIMAQQGIFIPAVSAVYPCFDKILSDIGDRQSIDNDLSTFSAHIQNLKEILETSDSKTLVLLDELGTGTDPDAGASIARAALENLLETSCFVLATTHLGALKIWAQDQVGISNGGMVFDSDALRPTFELQMGLPGSSFALEISNRLGLDKKVINRAESLMNSGIVKSEALIEELQNKSQKLEKLIQGFNFRETELKKREEKILKQETEIEISLTNLKKKSAGETEVVLKKYRKEIENLVSEIRANQADKSSIKKAKQFISSELNTAQQNLSEKTIEVDSEPILSSEIEVGLTVSIPHLDLKGKVTTLPDKKSKVTLDVDGKRISLPLEKLFRCNLEEEDISETRSSFHTVSKPESYQLDLRGKTVDVALEKMTAFLDQSLLAGLGFVHLIHGKGTGALQEAVQNEVKEISYVKSCKFAEPKFGGTGVTIVELK